MRWAKQGTTNAAMVEALTRPPSAAVGAGQIAAQLDREGKAARARRRRAPRKPNVGPGAASNVPCIAEADAQAQISSTSRFGAGGARDHHGAGGDSGGTARGGLAAIGAGGGGAGGGGAGGGATARSGSMATAIASSSVRESSPHLAASSLARAEVRAVGSAHLDAPAHLAVARSRGSTTTMRGELPSSIGIPRDRSRARR